MCGVCAASSDNGIGDEGAKGLAEGLSSNSTLQTLDLRGAHGGRGAGRGVGRSGSGRDGEGSGGGLSLNPSRPSPVPVFHAACPPCPSLSLVHGRVDTYLT